MELSMGYLYQPNIIVWNVQGAGSGELLNMLREHIRMHRPGIVALVETRISGPKAQTVCNRTGFRRSIRVEARGFSGGIWVLWNDVDLELEVINTHDQLVTVGIKIEGQVAWFLTVIYASPHVHIRDNLWPVLTKFATSCEKPWLLAGDFNETATMDE